MYKRKILREAALKTIAIEVDQALRIGPVTHIKHQAVTSNHQGLGGLESHLLGTKDGKPYSLHEWGYYGDVKAPSIIMPEAPRGFFIALKQDSEKENRLRGGSGNSIPIEAKTPEYDGDYIKIDWVYPHKDIIGLGIPRQYFFAVERAAKKVGYPSIHIDATHNGLSYWSREEFGLAIPEIKHETLADGYQRYLEHPKKYTEQAISASCYVGEFEDAALPDEIDPSKPHTIPKIFMDVIGVSLMEQGGHLHFYKKF